MADTTKKPDDEAVTTEAGKTFLDRVGEDASGAGRVVRGADDDPKEAADAAEMVAAGAGIVMAPQHWDPVTQTFSASAEDPYADNLKAANEAQTDPGPRMQNLSSKKS